MNFKDFKEVVAIFAITPVFMFAESSIAATDGNLQTGTGATSTGTSVITLNVPDMIKITNLNDITMTQNGTVFDGTDDVCVYRNITGAYGVTAQSANDPAGTGTAGNFVLSDGAGSTVQYSVDWNATTLTEDTESSFNNADTTSVNCGGTPNITITVTSTQNEVAKATTSVAHTDTLSVFVTAQ